MPGVPALAVISRACQISNGISAFTSLLYRAVLFAELVLEELFFQTEFYHEQAEDEEDAAEDPEIPVPMAVPVSARMSPE